MAIPEAPDDGELLPSDLLRKILISSSTPTSPQEVAALRDLFIHEYHGNQTAFSSAVREACKEIVIKLVASLRQLFEDEKFLKAIQYISNPENTHTSEYQSQADFAMEFYYSLHKINKLTVHPLEDLMRLSDEFSFLREVINEMPSMPHFFHDVGNSMLGDCIMDARSIRDVEEAERGMLQRSITTIPAAHQQAHRVVSNLETMMTGEHNRSQVDIGKLFRDFLTVIAQRRFFYRVEDFEGDERHVIERGKEKTIYVRIDSRLNEIKVRCDENGIWNYLYNLFKNTFKEIKSINGWIIFDVRLSEDGRYVLIEVTDNGAGFNPNTALKSAAAETRRTVGYMEYLKRELPVEVVNLISSWDTNAYAIRSLELPYGRLLDLFLLDRISGRSAQEKSGSTTFGVGLSSMNRTMNAHHGTVILTNTPGAGAKILTVLPVDPDGVTPGEIETVTREIEQQGLGAIAGV